MYYIEKPPRPCHIRGSVLVIADDRATFSELQHAGRMAEIIRRHAKRVTECHYPKAGFMTVGGTIGHRRYFVVICDPIGPLSVPKSAQNSPANVAESAPAA